MHGNQDKRFFHGYYDNYCFLPLYVFCGSQLLVAYLRPSNIDPALHRSLLRRSACYAEASAKAVGYEGCRNNVGYIIGVIRNPVLEKLAHQWIDRAKMQSFDGEIRTVEPSVPGIVVGCCIYSGGYTSHRRTG
jgi:hypothetical protein